MTIDMTLTRAAATLAVVIFCAAGCAGRNKGTPDQTSYERFFKQNVSDVSKKRQGSMEKDSSDLKELPEMTSEERERLGDSHFSKGNLRVAFVHYDKAVRLEPDNVRLRYKRGLLFVVGRLNDEAIQEFQEILKKEPQNGLALEGLGMAYFQLERYEDAAGSVKQALAADSNLWKSHNFLGVIYDYTGRHEEAVKEYTAALALKPGSGLLYNNLGISHLLAGDNHKAAWAFQKAVELKATEPRVYNNLGLALSRLGRMEEAFEAFKKAGDEAQAYNNIGCAHMERGEYSQAHTCFKKALELRPTFYEKADENLKRCLRTYPLEARAEPFEDSEPTMWIEISEPKTQTAHASVQKDSGGYIEYIVKEGDTAYSIAKRHNMNFTEFLKLNNLTDKSIIRPGQALKARPQ